MSKRRSAYPPEFRRQMVELVRSGRNPEELSRDFEPTAQAIRNWAPQADRDEGRGADGLTTAPNARSWAVCGGRTASSGSSARSCQKPRPGSLERPDRSRRRVREFVKRNQAEYPVAALCRILGVATSGYYA